VQNVPWADYWTKLPTDIAAGTAADIYWTNTSNFGLYADNNQLLPIRQMELNKEIAKLKGDEKIAAADKASKLAEMEKQFAELNKQIASMKQ